MTQSISVWNLIPSELLWNILLHNLHPVQHLLPFCCRIHLVVFSKMLDIFWVREILFSRILDQWSVFRTRARHSDTGLLLSS